jgi:hypothetical protein
MVRPWRKFHGDEQGVSLVEGLIVFPLILLAISTFVEFGIAVLQWNQTVKAMQLGARLLAVSDPLVADMGPLTADYPPEQGGPTPAAAVSVSCGPGGAPCIADRVNRLVFGSDGSCNPAVGTSLSGMCDFNPAIGVNNVFVTYHRSGLGYVGRPDGPVVTVTLEARNLTFNFMFLGALLGLNSIEIPAHPVTMTGEDLSSCRDECP